MQTWLSAGLREITRPAWSATLAEYEAGIAPGDFCMQWNKRISGLILNSRLK